MNREYTPDDLQPKAVHITRLLFREVYGLHEQYQRPYQVAATGDVTNRIATEVAQPGDFTGQSIITAGNQLLQPAATPATMINIPNGWQERRLRFVMEIEFTYNLGIKREIISGYTDYIAATQQGSIDPNMVMHINTVIPVRDIVYTNSLGQRSTQQRLDPPVHVLANKHFKEDTLPENMPSMFLNTPTTVLNNISVEMIENAARETVVDTSKVLTPFAMPIQRYVTSPTRFAGKLINDYKNSIMSLTHAMVADPRRSAISNIRGTGYDDWYGNVDFLLLLKNLTGASGRTFVTYGELLRVDPYVDSITQIHFQKPSQAYVPTEFSEHFLGANYVTQQAVAIANIIPNILLDFAVATCTVHATNKTMVHDPMVTITSINGVFGGDMTNVIPAIVAKIKQELVPVISQSDTILFTLAADVNVFGNTRIDIALGADDSIPYIIPSFCDALLVPEVTPNHQDVTEMTSAFNGIFDIVDDTLAEKGLYRNNALPAPSTIDISNNFSVY